LALGARVGIVRALTAMRDQPNTTATTTALGWSHCAYLYSWRFI